MKFSRVSEPNVADGSECGTGARKEKGSLGMDRGQNVQAVEVRGSFSRCAGREPQRGKPTEGPGLALPISPRTEYVVVSSD